MLIKFKVSQKDQAVEEARKLFLAHKFPELFILKVERSLLVTDKRPSKGNRKSVITHMYWIS